MRNHHTHSFGGFEFLQMQNIEGHTGRIWRLDMLEESLSVRL